MGCCSAAARCCLGTMGSTLAAPASSATTFLPHKHPQTSIMKTVETKEEFDSIIKETQILVVVDFFATWCGPCKAIAPTLEKWATEYEGKVLFIKVDVDVNEETAEKAEVSAMPTFHFYKGGEKIAEVVGANQAVLEEKIKALTA